MELLPWAELWYNTTYHHSLGMSPFQALYGRTPPKIIGYQAGDSNVEAADVLLQRRDRLLRELCSNLQAAQERMKKYADVKRREFEFVADDWVWLRLQPYRQHSVNRHTFLKLAKCFYGPFLVKEKISLVAYKLQLPPSSSIYPVFHIALLKPFKGMPPDQIINPLPPLATDSHPIIHRR